jgi:hypothetical protein
VAQTSRNTGLAEDVALRTHSNSLRHVAVGYVERGWPVIPIWPVVENTGSALPPLLRALGYQRTPTNCTCLGDCSAIGKHPAMRQWTKWAVIDPDAAHRLWSERPWGIGIELGGAGLVVIDCDAPSAVNWWQSSPWASVDTLTVSTSPGRKHVYFRQEPGDVLLRRASQAQIYAAHQVPKLEVRGNGDFTVAPPSMHWTGGQYQWLNPAAAVAPLPDDLRAWIVAASGPPRARHASSSSSDNGTGAAIWNPEGWVHAALIRMERSGDGHRNNDVTAVARALRDVARAGHYDIADLRHRFIDSARACGVLDDELTKSWECWSRNAEDPVTLEEFAALCGDAR